MRPVRIVVGFTVGGIYDTYARLIAQWLSEHLRQPFIIENRTGAGGSIATEAVVPGRRLTDTRCSLLAPTTAWNTASMTISISVTSATSRPSPASPREWALWSCLRRFPRERFTNSSPTLGTIQPRVTIASDGVGSGPHVFWELFRSMTGLNLLHVPYRGAPPVIIDLLSGTGAGVLRLYGAS